MGLLSLNYSSNQSCIILKSVAVDVDVDIGPVCLAVERELVQKRTFTRWINLHLEKVTLKISIYIYIFSFIVIP